LTYQELAKRFARELEATLGPRFAGLFTYGAACFPPSPVTDLDGHVLLNGPLDDDERRALDALDERLDTGDLEMDVWYITLDDARRSERPTFQRDTSRVDDMWAIHRAHVHAGRYVPVAGIDPREIVPEPTWEELDVDLQRELADLEDATEGEYAVLNLCRIAASYANRNVVMSKLQGALWAFGALPDEHHAVIREALEGYRTMTFGRVDARPFYAVMREKIEAVRF
jgi:hypothetical protein